ncbi:MAG: flavin reductase [Rhodobacteraceae bacterium]|nr:flavin reductase [Paracoccaceae bacterium]
MNNHTNDTDFNPHAFRRALGNFATGVTIVTAQGPAGDIVGVTASSFNSLSMDPPLILWSSKKDARSCAIFEAASHFTVNVLASDQMDMSNRFARQQDDKFEGIDWQEGLGGAPIFPNCAGRFQCESHDKLDGGDHWIFVGKVKIFDDFGRPPLCFHRGSYSMLFNHLSNEAQGDEIVESSAGGGRVANHKFFLMLKAIRAYQDAYQLKLSALDLSLIEGRALLVMNNLSGVPAEQLVPHLNAPLPEVREALLTLESQNLITSSSEGFTLTQAGHAKANQCWRLADAHADEVFDGFSPDQIETFTNVLRKLIQQ